MFFLLSKILASLFHPLTWIIVLLLVSFILRKNAMKISFRLAALFMLIIFSNSWLTYLAVERWEHQISDQFKSNAAYDVAIVLGGGMVEKDSISGNLVFRNNTDRIMQAVELYRQHEVKKILICGGSAKAFRYEVPEALLLKEYLVANSIVPLRDIWIDTVSRNTRENAVEAKKLLGAYKGPDRFLLVTSAMHMK
nr:YdcF family protein [Bacteroidota bacterium]